MARYLTRLRTKMRPEEVFDLLADMGNAASWDPGVLAVKQVSGDGGGPDGAWDVTVKAPRGSTIFRYETLEYQRPRRVLLRSDTRWFSSVDEVVVTTAGDETELLYDAELTFGNVGFVSRLANPILQRVFDRVGEEAMRGLRAAVDGREVQQS
ncbi:MAG: SRPBCC family protein [Acidimicrobiales bacterium]